MRKKSSFRARIFAPILLNAFWAFTTCFLAASAISDETSKLRHPAVIISAEIVFALMVLGWALMLSKPGADGIARLVWTLGAITLLIHIAIAIWLAHGWSHEAAVEHVREVGGFGAGILASYLFALIWVSDVVWWWVSPLSRSHRPCWVSWAVHCYLVFIAFNATVVFGVPERRLVYVAMFLVPGIPLLMGRLRITEK